MTNVEPRRGQRFTHNHFLHPDDRHLPAKQARKAVMVITSVSVINDCVYYTYASTVRSSVARGAFYMQRDEWQQTYGAANHD